MQSKRTELAGMFAKLALSFVVASAVFAGALGQAHASSDPGAAAKPGTHEIVCTCDNCGQDEPDDTDIEEMLELAGERDDPVVRPIPHGQS